MVAADNVKRPKALKISIQLFKLFLVILNSIVANNYQKKSMPDSPILFKFLQNATTLNKFVEHCNFVVQVISLSLSIYSLKMSNFLIGNFFVLKVCKIICKYLGPNSSKLFFLAKLKNIVS